MSNQLHPNFHYEIQNSELGQTRQALCRTLGELEMANRVLRSRERHYASMRLRRIGDQVEVCIERPTSCINTADRRIISDPSRIEPEFEWITIATVGPSDGEHVISAGAIHDAIRRHLIGGKYAEQEATKP